jgi:hypothetical protein
LIEWTAVKVFFAQLYSAHPAIKRRMDDIDEWAALRLVTVSDKIEMEIEQGSTTVC